MARAAHPDAMRPSKPGPTRTALPLMPPQFPTGGRYRAYVAFDATGLVYLMAGFIALRIVWMLGSGEEAWLAVQGQLANPLYIGFHALALLSVLFVGVRFFRLFPKAQPPRIGPLKPPPQPVIIAGLYAAWIGTTALMTAILSGRIF